MISELGRSSVEGSGNPLQYSGLENPMDRGTWRATVHRVAKSQTWLKRLSMHACPPHTTLNLDKIHESAVLRHQAVHSTRI